MISARVAALKQGLERLGCTVNQFARLAGLPKFPQPRLAEALRGVRELSPYELKYLEALLSEMAGLADDVRKSTGSRMRVCWVTVTRQALDSRRMARLEGGDGAHDFGVGITHELRADLLMGVSETKDANHERDSRDN